LIARICGVSNLKTWLFQRTPNTGSLCLVLALALVAPTTAAQAQSLVKGAKQGEATTVAPVPQTGPGAAASGVGAIQSQLNSIVNQQGIGTGLPGNVAPAPQPSQGAVGATVPQANAAGNTSDAIQSQLNSIQSQLGSLASMSAQIGQAQSTLNSVVGNALGNLGPVPQANAAGNGAAAQSQLNSIQSQLGSLASMNSQISQAQSTLNSMLGSLGNAGPVPQANVAGNNSAATQSQINSIQNQLGSLASMTSQMSQAQSTLNAMLGSLGNAGAVSQANAAGSNIAATQSQLNSIQSQLGSLASMNSQISQAQSTLNSMLGGAGNVAPAPQAGQIGGIAQTSVDAQVNQIQSTLNDQISKIRDSANQMLGMVQGGSASVAGKGGTNPSAINLNPSAPAFGSLLNPTAPAPQATIPSTPSALAVATAVNIYVQVAGAAGITIPAGAVPVVQDLANCAVSGMSGNACAGNVVLSTVLKELGAASPGLADALTPIANCLAGGGQPKACINPSALPSAVQPLANCILNGGNAGVCAENNVVLQALPNGARQVMQTVVSTLATLQVGSSSLQQPPGLANIVSIAGGIASGNWSSVVAGVGEQNAGVAAQAIASAYLPAGAATTLFPIITTMIQNNAFQAGFSALSQGDAVGLAEVAFQWYANQYLQAPCQVMPSGSFKDTVCGGAAAALNAVADVAGDVAKDVLGIGKDILQFLGLWNAVDDVASTVWDGVTSVISDIGNFITGKKNHTVECVGWSPPSQYFGNVLASCMPNMASAAGAAGHAPDTTSVYDACVNYYGLCPAYNQQATAANCQKIASALGTAAQNASNTLNAAAAAYTNTGAATFVAAVYADPNQRKYDNFCSGNFWPVERQQYAKQCAAALAKYYPSYASAPSSNACPVQTASSAMQQACLNAIDSSSTKNLFAGNSSSLYCQQQQQADVIVPASNARTTLCLGGNNPLPTVFTPLNLADAVPVMTVGWQSTNKTSKVAGINFMGATSCEPQSSAVNPPWLPSSGSPVSLPFKHVTLPVAISMLPPVNSSGSILGGIENQIAKAVASLPPTQSDSGTSSGAKKSKKGQPASGGSVNGATKGGPRQASTGNGGTGGTNGIGGDSGNSPTAKGGSSGSGSAMDTAAGLATGGGLSGVAGTGGFGPAIPGRPTVGGLRITPPPTGVIQAKNPPPKGGGSGGTNGTFSQGAGKPFGGGLNPNGTKVTTLPKGPAAPKAPTMPMTDYGGCSTCAQPPPPPEIIK
jgi:prefoldin subunit 5